MPYGRSENSTGSSQCLKYFFEMCRCSCKEVEVRVHVPIFMTMCGSLDVRVRTVMTCLCSDFRCHRIDRNSSRKRSIDPRKPSSDLVLTPVPRHRQRVGICRWAFPNESLWLACGLSCLRMRSSFGDTAGATDDLGRHEITRVSFCRDQRC